MALQVSLDIFLLFCTGNRYMELQRMNSLYARPKLPFYLRRFVVYQAAAGHVITIP